MHWRDIGTHKSVLEAPHPFYRYECVVATVHQVLGGWVVERRDGSRVAVVATEEEAKAVATVTFRMEQADGT